MKIIELFESKEPVFSFEFFPPKTPAGEANLLATLEELAVLDPGYVSVTYGAGGSTRDRTLDLVAKIKGSMELEPMAHLTCVGASRSEISEVLDRLEESKIENVIALRGDPPEGQTDFVVHKDGLAHGSDLVAMIREQDRPFCVAAAAYPEGHVEAESLDHDLEHLIAKVDAGTELLITQLFFENAHYFRFVERARDVGISVPIVPGIMPITNVGQIERFTNMCGATIPTDLHDELDRERDNADAVIEIGIRHAEQQCRELINNGAPGVHFYTLNKSTSTRETLTRLRA